MSESAAGPSGTVPGQLRVTFCYASPQVQYVVALELPGSSTAEAARVAARQRLQAGQGILEVDPEVAREAGSPAAAALREIPWEGADCGVFGTAVAWSTPLQDGDRVEVYRPLLADPKVSRRNRVADARRRGTESLTPNGRSGRGRGGVG
jgi:putative ubiquitin-RnfH superfamily antitoxin RatB of RatAB toxin-antitoxin module